MKNEFKIKENKCYFEGVILDRVFETNGTFSKFYETQAGEFIGLIDGVDVIVEVVADNAVRLRPLYSLYGESYMESVRKAFISRATSKSIGVTELRVNERVHLAFYYQKAEP
jgi:hypothetical protein